MVKSYLFLDKKFFNSILTFFLNFIHIHISIYVAQRTNAEEITSCVAPVNSGSDTDPSSACVCTYDFS